MKPTAAAGKIGEGEKPCRLALLGAFRLTGADGRDCPIPAAKQRAILAILSLAPGAAASAERLKALLWSDRGEAQARDSLKHALSDLRERLSGLGCQPLATDRSRVALDLGAVAVDALEFAAQADAADADGLSSALALYTGDLLEGLSIRDEAFEDWLRQERGRLRGLAEQAAGRGLAMAERAAEPTAIHKAAQRLLQLDPLREDAVRAEMRLRAAEGEKAAALRLYTNLADALSHQLQTVPDPETERLAASIRTNTALAAARPAPADLPLHERPSIAVLPFKNLSESPRQDYFAEGVTEDIITALSHFRWFFVIARNATTADGDRNKSPAEVARALGARYILDGSVRKIGDRVRLTGELIDAETGHHVWGERYDRELADIFALQDELTRQVAGAIEPEILRGESQRALSKAPTSLDAYDCHMRGVWFHNLQGGPEDFEQAILWQRRAIEIDPGLARAYMILARSLYARCLYGYSADLDRDRSDLLAAATRAVSLEDRDAYAHYAMCCAHLLNLQPGAAMIDAERATELAPNLALVQNGLGWARIFAGRFEEAIAPIETAMQLSPRDPITYFFNSRLGLAHYHLGNYEAAARFSQRSLYARPRYFNMLTLLACFGQLARSEDAEALLPQVRANEPADVVRFWQFIFPYADPTHRIAMEEGLQKAGYRLAR